MKEYCYKNLIAITLFVFCVGYACAEDRNSKEVVSHIEPLVRIEVDPVAKATSRVAVPCSLIVSEQLVYEAYLNSVPAGKIECDVVQEMLLFGKSTILVRVRTRGNSLSEGLFPKSIFPFSNMRLRSYIDVNTHASVRFDACLVNDIRDIRQSILFDREKKSVVYARMDRSWFSSDGVDTVAPLTGLACDPLTFMYLLRTINWNDAPMKLIVHASKSLWLMELSVIDKQTLDVKTAGERKAIIVNCVIGSLSTIPVNVKLWIDEKTGVLLRFEYNVNEDKISGVLVEGENTPFD